MATERDCEATEGGFVDTEGGCVATQFDWVATVGACQLLEVAVWLLKMAV